MKKYLHLLLPLTLLTVLLGACDDDRGYYYNDYDEYLPGRWELIYADGRPVAGYMVNYLDFYDNGYGMFYYYDRGVPYEMELRWGVELWNATSVLYITYEDGSQVSMDYWYNSNATRLYTSWYEGPYRHEYVYQLIDDFAWPAPARASQSAPAEDEDMEYPLFPGK